MNNQAVTKINKIGKAGSIVVLILKIFLIIGFVGCLIGLIAITVLPKDFVTVSMNGEANINVDLSSFGEIETTDEMESAIRKELEDSGALSYGGASILLDEVEVADSNISFTGSGQIMDFSLKNCSYAIVAAMVTIAMSFVTLLFTGFLVKAFANCKSPFDEDVIRKMKNFAYSLIPWTVISGVGNAIISYIFSNGKMNYNISVNVTYIFIILVILGLTYIFQYGAELQRESDETL